jgi:hypothetical protein
MAPNLDDPDSLIYLQHPLEGEGNSKEMSETATPPTTEPSRETTVHRLYTILRDAYKSVLDRTTWEFDVPSVEFELPSVEFEWPTFETKPKAP